MKGAVAQVAGAGRARPAGRWVGGAWAVGGAAEKGGGWSSPEAATAEAAVPPAAATAAARVGPVDLPVVDRPLVETVPFSFSSRSSLAANSFADIAVGLAIGFQHLAVDFSR
jgi:hypothetical protein